MWESWETYADIISIIIGLCGIGMFYTSELYRKRLRNRIMVNMDPCVEMVICTEDPSPRQKNSHRYSEFELPSVAANVDTDVTGMCASAHIVDTILTLCFNIHSTELLAQVCTEICWNPLASIRIPEAVRLLDQFTNQIQNKEMQRARTVLLSVIDNGRREACCYATLFLPTTINDDTEVCVDRRTDGLIEYACKAYSNTLRDALKKYIEKVNAVLHDWSGVDNFYYLRKKNLDE